MIISLLNSKETSSTLLSINEITTAVEPSPSSQSKNCYCLKDNSGLIIGVGFLLLTNIITVIVFIISCLWLLKSIRNHEKL